MIDDMDLDEKILNDYKISLYQIQKLPVSIINKIIDEYIDTRTQCKDCNFVFSSLNDDILDGCAIECSYCNQWICHYCIRVVFIDYTFEKFCQTCISYDKIENHDN